MDWSRDWRLAIDRVRSILQLAAAGCGFSFEGARQDVREFVRGSVVLEGVVLGGDRALAELARVASQSVGVQVRLYHLDDVQGPDGFYLRRSDRRAPDMVLIDLESPGEPEPVVSKVRAWARHSNVPVLFLDTADAKAHPVALLSDNEHFVDKRHLEALVASAQIRRPSEVEGLARSDTPRAAEPSISEEQGLRQLVADVRDTARKICQRVPETVRADAESAAMVGLMEAVRRLEDADPAYFLNYLRVRVRGAIRDETRRFDPLSRSARELVTRVERAAEEYFKRHGEAADASALASMLGISEDTAWHALELSELSTLPIDDDLAGQSVRTAEDMFVETYTATALRWALSRLEERTRLVLRLWYKRGLPAAAIARRLGISESRVHQLRVEGEGRLAKLLARPPSLRTMRTADVAFDWDEVTADTARPQEYSS